MNWEYPVILATGLGVCVAVTSWDDKPDIKKECSLQHPYTDGLSSVSVQSARKKCISAAYHALSNKSE